MSKSFLPKRAAQSGDMNLQITSMADIFIIILVFLLKSYSSGAMNLAPSKGVMLPNGTLSDAPVEALKIEISDSGVQVEGKPAATLASFAFDPSDLDANKVSKSLVKVLSTERQRQLLIAKANSDVKVDGKVIILVDQHAPYSTIKAVLAAAATQGYTDFKLAVVKGE